MVSQELESLENEGSGWESSREESQGGVTGSQVGRLCFQGDGVFEGVEIDGGDYRAGGDVHPGPKYLGCGREGCGATVCWGRATL